MTERERPRVLVLDLHDDPELIARYRAWHAPGATPPAVIAALRASGVTQMQIHLSGDRLVMIVEGGDGAEAAAATQPELEAWERLMDEFQKPVPWADHGAKWTPATCIFDLASHDAFKAET